MIKYSFAYGNKIFFVKVHILFFNTNTFRRFDLNIVLNFELITIVHTEKKTDTEVFLRIPFRTFKIGIRVVASQSAIKSSDFILPTNSDIG